MKRRLSVMLVVLAALGLTAVSALAGGWATVTLDEMPPEIHAGTSQTIHFHVWQHGQTPVHSAFGQPIEPLLIATNPATGERLEVVATPAEEAGRFVVETTFPSEGEWTWQILPNPLALEGELPPLTVLPAMAPVAAPAAETQSANLVAWGAVLALVLALGVTALWFGRRAEAPTIRFAEK